VVIKSNEMPYCWLADAIGNMKKLQILNLTNNQLLYLPRAIGKLKELEEFSVQ